jgi:ABC-type transporter Mla MlaB component
MQVTQRAGESQCSIGVLIIVMTRRSSPKAAAVHADTNSESMKLTRAARRASHRIPLTVSTKSPKRKRAAVAPAPESIAGNALPIDTAVAAEIDAQTSETATMAALSPAAVDAVLDATAILEPPASGPVDPIIALSSNSTVKDAQALKAEMMKLLDLPDVVAIDVRSVERIDTATMQLLCAFVRDRAERNATVQWLGSPPAIVDAARLLGVQHMLAFPTEGVA